MIPYMAHQLVMSFRLATEFTIHIVGTALVIQVVLLVEYFRRTIVLTATVL